MSMMRNLSGANVPTGTALTRLSDLGMQVQSDGSLTTNSTKLDAALQTPSNVKALFSNVAATANENGVAKRIYDFAYGALASGGSVATHNAAFQKAIERNNVTITKFNDHIAQYQKQLLSQYNALDASMAKLSGLSSYVSQQITTWNKSG
jgi:flagellar hook-associated protein 2